MRARRSLAGRKKEGFEKIGAGRKTCVGGGTRRQEVLGTRHPGKNPYAASASEGSEEGSWMKWESSLGLQGSTNAGGMAPTNQGKER